MEEYHKKGDRYALDCGPIGKTEVGLIKGGANGDNNNTCFGVRTEEESIHEQWKSTGRGGAEEMMDGLRQQGVWE